jgi:hypothetical protein
MRASKPPTFVLGPIAVAALAMSLVACNAERSTSPLGSAPAGASFAANASAAGRCALPFHGVLDATESDQLTFPTLRVQLTGSGTATHVGKYTMTLETTVTLPQATSVGGVLRLTAANGDRINASVAGQAVVNGDIADIVEVATITGGTGRFAGATGSYTITRSLAQSTGISSGSFDGTICF